MPFVQRVVEPKFLSRTSLRDVDGRSRVTDQELQAVTNCTLSNALRQLASLVLLAEDIFSELTEQLHGIAERSKAAQERISKLGEAVDSYDPKKVPVPEGSLSDFALCKVHYKAANPLKKDLFTPDTRPPSLKNLYEKASSDKFSASILDQLRKDAQHSQYLLCTPVLSAKRKRLYSKLNVDIETRIPSAVEHLRKWTSKEAIGDVTALPDASIRITSGVTLTPEELSECGSGDEEPIDHRLPSPEEQLRIIASKFSPEVIAIDTSGKFFDRMCSSRKSLIHIEAGTGETDTVKRRTRTRKPRGKRRNTISGTDQKELREAIAGDTTNGTTAEEAEDSSIVIRSHSSDLLKKSPLDPASKKSHFNTLKQWGKNRLKLISRSPSASRDSFRECAKSEKNIESKSPTRVENELQETVTMRRKKTIDDDRRSSHQRCASYSSSEKSIGIPTNVTATATINTGVKLRGSAVQRRLRRSGIGREEPNSSSGNWSASSESGRTSIGSEITTTTVPPKSTTSAATSNNSLNFHGHGPPSSIISRRRFLNTSGSGSVTSEGTLTPDIINDLHEDLETSSEFSCDTEGYYTSFHMDSGLKTLKEEELSPSTPLHTSNALSNSSNIQNLTAENEYELFGKGSTSTTTSSAGTVCTTLMAAGSDRSLVIGPTVPERKSSLTKINRSRSGNIHGPNGSLDKSLTSSFSKKLYNMRFNTMRAYVDQHSSSDINGLPTSTITITKNVGMPREMTAVAEIHRESELECAKKSTGTSSPDSGHNTSSSPIEDSVSSAPGKNSLSEQDYSESSDLEGTDRIERIKYKTTISSARIPSLCVITPTNSDDESVISARDTDCVNKRDRHDTIIDPKVCKKNAARPKLDLPTVDDKNKDCKTNNEINKLTKLPSQITLKTSLQPFNNFMCKLKGVLPHKMSNKKANECKELDCAESFYDAAGDYVTIADVKNNNQKIGFNKGIYGSNDIVKKNLQTVLSGKLQETEYVSLNELPNCLRESKDFLHTDIDEISSPASQDLQMKGAKVTLDSEGQVVYSSDTLKRRKGAHTTFEPGPFVQEKQDKNNKCVIPESDHLDETDFPHKPTHSSKTTSSELGTHIIRTPTEPNGPVNTDFIPLPSFKPETKTTTTTPINELPSRLVSQNLVNTKQQDLPRVVDAIPRTGAFVKLHDAEGVSLSPTKDHLQDYRHSSADKPFAQPMHGIIQDRNTLISYPPANVIPQQSNLRARNDTINYNNQQTSRDQPTFWTLPKRTEQLTSQRSLTPEILPDLQTRNKYQPRNTNDNTALVGIVPMSPIDPRSIGVFKSSTPTNKDNVTNLSAKLLSPIKSSMTNEELYAVIHKSKKKLNIRDTNDRCNSPALSTLSLSPVNSESSLVMKGSQKQPETGYLADPRSRNSWACASENILQSPYRTHARTESTCADRLGPAPQTSRLDFKKLLLQHSTKSNTLNPQIRPNKLSAVEQLKLSKETPNLVPPPSSLAASNMSHVNILDLSGSPKTYNQRKMFKTNPHPISPGRANILIKEHKSTPKILLSPKSQWRFSSPRSDVLSTPIPEANNEDDNSNSSGEKSDVSPKNAPATVPIVTNKHFGARRNLIPINENITESDNDPRNQGIFPIVIEALKTPPLSRTELLQAKRAQFFNSTPESPPKLSSFRGNTTPSTSRDKTSPEGGKSSPTLETAL